MSKTFLQYKGSWAKHLYPTNNKKHSTYSTSGCGTCMLASVIYNKNNAVTPEVVGKYISSIGGATQGGATYHWAIKKTANHFGLNCKEVSTMSEFLKLMKTGKYWGGLLFRAGSRGGIKWTGGGHYIACTDTRGTDELYMRDSGTRGHIGWYSYSKHMKGLIKKAWVFWLPTDNSKQVTKIEPKTANQLRIEKVVSFAKKYCADNSYKYKKWTSNEKTHQCPICHPNSGKGWNCIGFVSACFYHSGVKVKCSCSGIGNDAFFNKNFSISKWKQRNGSYWTKVTEPKMGDIIICYKNKKYKHTALYLGDGKIADATSKYGIAIRNYSALKGYSKIVIRYTGN